MRHAGTIFAALVLMMVPAGKLHAEMTNEAGTVTALSIKKNFTPEFNLCLRQELWTKDNITKLDFFLIRISANYKPLKWLTLGVHSNSIIVASSSSFREKSTIR